MAIRIPSPSTGLVDAAAGLAAALGRRLNAALRAVQHARMMQALGEMTDRDLAKIGLARADIPAYAARLVCGEDR